MLAAYLEAMAFLYHKTPHISSRDNVIHARITSKVVVEDLLTCASFGLKKWNVPKKVLCIGGANEEWIKSFFSAEAYVASTHIKVQTINSKGMAQVSELLFELGINHRCYSYMPKKENHSMVHIIFINRRADRLKYMNTIGFHHRKKHDALNESLSL
jgi:hypothetical protein